jgi:hypothetical protein
VLAIVPKVTLFFICSLRVAISSLAGCVALIATCLLLAGQLKSPFESVNLFPQSVNLSPQSLRLSLVY